MVLAGSDFDPVKCIERRNNLDKIIGLDIITLAWMIPLKYAMPSTIIYQNWQLLIILNCFRMQHCSAIKSKMFMSKAKSLLYKLLNVVCYYNYIDLYATILCSILFVLKNNWAVWLFQCYSFDICNFISFQSRKHYCYTDLQSARIVVWRIKKLL